MIEIGVLFSSERVKSCHFIPLNAAKKMLVIKSFDEWLDSLEL